MCQNLKQHCKTIVKTWFLAYRWRRNPCNNSAKSMQISSSQNVCKKYIKSVVNLMKMTAKRHPRGVEGAQNEPRGVQKTPKSVNEASRRRQARFTRFQATKVTRRQKRRSPNRLPVREVNWTKSAHIPTSLHTLENQPCPYTHWCAGGHGADLKAKASCRRP